jgi:VWFA-related protein
MKSTIGFALPFLLTLSLTAQTTPPSQPAQAPLAASTVQLDITVTDHSNKPVAGLAQSSFTILDNGAAQQVLSFQAVNSPSKEQPVEVYFLIDTVNDNLQTVGVARQHLGEFLKKSGPTTPYPSSLVVLTEETTQIQRIPSTSTADLLTALNAIPTQSRILSMSTGFEGAAQRAQISLRGMQQFIEAVQTKPGRKILVWLSSGWEGFADPTLNLSNRDQQLLFRQVVNLSNQLDRARITIFSVDPLGSNSTLGTYYQEFLKGVPNKKVVGWPHVSLPVLAIHSGGEVVLSGKDVPAEISHCIESAAAFYTITIPRAQTTSEKPDVLHTLQIKLADPSLKPHTLFGYYAEP